MRKTNEDRLKRIQDLCNSHFGDIKFVGVKLQANIGWVAKVQFSNSNYFSSLSAEGKTATEAIKKLKNRVKKIIKRYNAI